jgi:hypothetical protein
MEQAAHFTLSYTFLLWSPLCIEDYEVKEARDTRHVGF